MTKTISIAIVGFVLMLSAQQVFAECVKECEDGIGDCMSQASKFVNDIEVEDAKIACNNKFMGCIPACDTAEEIRTGRMPPVQQDDSSQDK